MHVFFKILIHMYNCILNVQHYLVPVVNIYSFVSHPSQEQCMVPDIYHTWETYEESMDIMWLINIMRGQVYIFMIDFLDQLFW